MVRIPCKARGHQTIPESGPGSKPPFALRPGGSHWEDKDGRGSQRRIHGPSALLWNTVLWISHSKNMFNATVKHCLMFITWLSHSGIHSSCTYLTKNYKDEINYNLRIDGLDDLQITPYEGVIDMSQFMGEEESFQYCRDEPIPMHLWTSLKTFSELSKILRAKLGKVMLWDI